MVATSKRSQQHFFLREPEKMERCMSFKVAMQNQLQSSLKISNENLGKARELFSGMDVITVIGPNGKCKISFKMSPETVTLEKGWDEFSRAHNVCKTDELIFIGGCHGIFFVLIFDKNGKAVEKRLESSETEAGEVASKHNDVEAQSRDQQRKAAAPKSRLPSKRKEFISISSDSSSGNNAGKGQASGVKKPHVKGEISDISDSSNSEAESQETMEVKCRKKAFISHRRSVSLAELKRAAKKARGFHPSMPYFRKKMKKTNVYRVFTVHIPIKFARANLPYHATKISLQVPGKTEKWEVNCKCRVYKKTMQHVWSIMGGWWQFSLANNLEKGDNLVFEMTTKCPCQLANNIINMKVHIFRVVEDIKPLEVL